MVLGLPQAPGPGIWRLGTSLGPLGLAEELMGGVVMTKAGVVQGCPGKGQESLQGHRVPWGQLFPRASDPS